MSELDARIVHLEPMWVASAYGFGSSPEIDAWTQLLAWADRRGLGDRLAAHHFFGFNNPDPSPGSPNYGYEQWMTVSLDTEPGNEVEIKEFAGGLYAVAQFKDLNNIGRVWRELVEWCEDSPYQLAHHQCLEELLTPFRGTAPEDYVFNLYLAIAE